MGGFLGYHIPEYNPFWEEDAYKDQPDYWKWYHLGYDDGMAEQQVYIVEQSKLSQENDSLRALIAANIRVNPDYLNDKENKTPV